MKFINFTRIIKPNIYKTERERQEDRLWVLVCDNLRQYLRKGAQYFDFIFVREVGKKNATKHIHALLIFNTDLQFDRMEDYLSKYVESKSKYKDSYTQVLTLGEACAYYKYIQKDHKYNVWKNAMYHTEFESNKTQDYFSKLFESVMKVYKPEVDLFVESDDDINVIDDDCCPIAKYIMP